MKALLTPLWALLLVALLAVCQRTVAAGDAGELLLGERLMGFKQPAAATTKAKAQSGYYGPLEHKIVSFQDSKFFGCGYSCCSDSFLQTEFTCKEDGYDYSNTNILLGGPPKAGSCTWEFKYYTFYNDGLKTRPNDAAAGRIGTAQGKCTLADNAEHCGADSPVCENLLMTINADLFEVPAFWTTPYTPPLVQDVGKKGDPTCCLLGPWFLGDQVYENGGMCEDINPEFRANNTRLGGSRGSDDLRSKGLSRKGTTKARTHDAPANTAYYSEPHAYTGTYYSGKAVLVSGIVTIVNARTREFRDTALLEWIAGVHCDDDKSGVCIETTGTPPTTLHPVTPGRLRFKFAKDAPAFADKEEKRY